MSILCGDWKASAVLTHACIARNDFLTTTELYADIPYADLAMQFIVGSPIAYRRIGRPSRSHYILDHAKGKTQTLKSMRERK